MTPPIYKIKILVDKSDYKGLLVLHNAFIIRYFDRTERHAFGSQFLCVVGKQRRTEKAGMGLTKQYIFFN